MPEGWHTYLEDSWDEWASTYQRLRAVNEPMRADEIAKNVGELCIIAGAWLGSIGVDYGFTGGPEYIFWTNETC